MIHSTRIDEKAAGYKFIPAKKYDYLTDEQLIERIRSGSTSLFEVIMRRYNQRLFRIQRTYIKDDDAVKDTLQMTYIRVYQHLHQFRGEARFSTWLTRIAINEALKYHAREKRYLSLLKPGSTNETVMVMRSDEKTPEENLIQADLRNLLEKHIDKLPDLYRTVYMMREIEHISSKETAEILDISESNVKIRLHRAKQMLRETLEHSVADAEVFHFLGERCDQIVRHVMQAIFSMEERRH